MELVKLKLSEIKPYENNPRKNDDAVEAVVESIKQCGYVAPIVVDENMVILAGHTRYKALKKLKKKEAQVVIKEGLSEEQKKKYRILDNKTAEIAEWDLELLEIELADLDFDGFDFGFELSGFESDDEELSEAEDDDYDFSQNIQSRAKVGDIYELGNHRLMCGDSTSTDDVERLIGGMLGDMVFTDPPYGVSIGDKNKRLSKYGKSGHMTENIVNDTFGEAELYELLLKAFINLREHCKDDCSYYVTAPQGGSLGIMMMMMRDAGLLVRHNLIWKKNVATFSMRRLDYDYQHEPIFYTWTKKHNYYGKGQYKTSIWEFDKPRKCDMHPTMKPIELIAEALLNSSKEGDIVIDFFGGSGSTLIACEQLGRCCRMMEIDPHYVDVIIDRWETLTGEKAVLLNG